MDLSPQAVSDVIISQPWFAAAPASVLLQVVALVRLRGPLRSVALILAVTTGTVGSLTVAAYHLDPGNLWQLLLMLASPPMLVLTAGVLLIGLMVRPRARLVGSSAHMALTPLYVKTLLQAAWMIS